jgi:hypothetical protein
MLRVANLPKDWRHWSHIANIDHLLGMRLDRAARDPDLTLARARFAAYARVWRTVFVMDVPAIRGNPPPSRG